MSKADLTKQPDQVAAMFDDVSTRYDRMNAVLSAGNASLWRIATTRAVDPAAGERILDVAAGTGTSSVALAKTGAHVVAADFSEGMIEVGRARHGDNPLVEFTTADATALPFDDDVFDAVTISFGLRNITDVPAALAEFRRVTRPGGRLVVCEFSTPPLAPLRRAYHAYLRYGMPVVARLISSNPAAYEYLMESIRDWPDQRALAGMLRAAGYESVAYRNLTAGIVALHRAVKPAVASEGAGPAAAGRDSDAVTDSRDAEASPAAGDTEVSPGGGDAEASPGGGDAEASPGGGDAEASPGGGDAEASPGGDDAEASPAAGDVDGPSSARDAEEDAA